MATTDRMQSGWPSSGQFSRVLARDIDGLLEARRAAERRKNVEERISDANLNRQDAP
jgi:hypothetical protein